MLSGMNHDVGPRAGTAAAWIDAVTQMGGDIAVATASSEDLVGRYSEPHRRYHGLRHVASVLSLAGELAADLGLSGEQVAVLALAACAHDVVYDAQPGQDERASADWARDHLERAGLGADLRERVADLVLLTLKHDVGEDDAVGAVLLDADLAILGAPLDVYDRYALAVREEFAGVPDDLWRLGRAHVLEGLLSKPRLFVTDAGHERWESAARANLDRELTALTDHR